MAMLGRTPGCRWWFGSAPGEGEWGGGAKEEGGCAVAEYMAPFSPWDKSLGATCCGVEWAAVGEVGGAVVSKLLAAVGVTGLAGWVVAERSVSLVLFFLRKPRLGIEAFKPREWAGKGGGGRVRARRHGGKVWPCGPDGS